MGRRYEYFCDNCGKQFGSSSHINGKALHIYKSEVTHYESNNPKATQWRQQPILNGSDEKHFCNGKCLGEFITNITPKELVFGKAERIHIIIKGICKNCGCSKKAIDNFKWGCNRKD